MPECVCFVFAMKLKSYLLKEKKIQCLRTSIKFRKCQSQNINYQNLIASVY